MTVGTINNYVEKCNGVSLGTAFNQEDAEAQRSTQAKQDDQAEGLKRKKGLDVQKLQYIKLGNTVSYSKGEGTVVSKDGMYVTLFNESANAYDEVHVGETYNPGDTISMGIMNKLWDQMGQEQRGSLLRKAMIAEPQHFVSRTWQELPRNLKDAIKENSDKSEVSAEHASHNTPSIPKRINEKGPKYPGEPHNPENDNDLGGKESPFSKDLLPKKSDEATEHMRGVEQTKEGQATTERMIGGRRRANTITSSPGLKDGPLQDAKMRKSDVEHGAYGGVVTDTPMDATEDYEECSRTGDRAQNQHNHQQKEPKNLKEDSKEIKIGYVGGETVKGNPDELEKEGGGSGASSSSSVSTSTPGVNNSVYNEERKLKNKYNTRYGPRFVTEEEAIQFINK